MAQTILVVDDEKSIVRLVSYNLQQAGYRTITAEDGLSALWLTAEYLPDLIVLDVMLPELDGFEVCRRLRYQGDMTPIIMLTARRGEAERVIGLELGADDYLVKPFSPRELVARARSLLRRLGTSGSRSETLHRGELVLNLREHWVRRGSAHVHLTSREFAVLARLAQEPGKVFTREQLLQVVWGYAYAGDTRSVDMHISNIRGKLEVVPRQPRYIETVRGVGYRFAKLSPCPVDAPI